MLFCLAEVSAHQVSSVSIVSLFDSQKHTYTVEAAMEVIPSADPKLNEQISPEDAARAFVKFLVLLFDGAQQQPEIQISLTKSSDTETPDDLQRQQVITKLNGKIPHQVKEFLLYVEPDCPMAVVMAVVLDGEPGRLQVILAGEYSLPVDLHPKVSPSEAAIAKEAADRTETTQANGAGASLNRLKDFRAVWSGIFISSPLPYLLILALLLLAVDRRELLVFHAFLFFGISLALAGSLLLSQGDLRSIETRESEILLSIFIGIMGFFTFPPPGRHRVFLLCLIFISGLTFGRFLWSVITPLAPSSIIPISVVSIIPTELGLLILLLASLALSLLTRFLIRDPARWRSVTLSLAPLLSGYALFYLTGLL